MKINVLALLLWVLGWLTFLPLFIAQLFMLIRPRSQKTKDLLIGKDEDWRDRTHYKSALAFAWADILIILPLFILGSTLMLTNNQWALIICIVLGVLTIYFSILFWVLEKEYTYKSVGPLAYYTYYWGFFLYWGVLAIVFALYQFSKLSLHF